jgi:DNA invertase Pin-like site-specific DNA recombinase
LRVSTGRQAESDLSIPDQRRQITAYCRAKGWDVAAEFVEPGHTATDDRWPAFQAMIDGALVKPPTFTVIIVHSFSRFFRDQFQFEFYVRKLAKNGVRLISITQDLGDDPMSVMMRQIMTLFDEYQSKENAKHTLRAMKENARQGYWNGALPPIGYRIVAAEQRGAKIKKKLEIDPIHADMVRLIYRLALNCDGDRGPMGSSRSPPISTTATSGLAMAVDGALPRCIRSSRARPISASTDSIRATTRRGRPSPSRARGDGRSPQLSPRRSSRPSRLR